jgi:hypothetical protein
MDDGLPTVGRFSPEWLDFLIVLGAIAFVLLLAFFWALFIRKRKGTRRRKRRHRRENLREQIGGIKKFLHERHRHREHRRPNPTLAQTGGLPPLREEKKPGGTIPPT